MLKHDALLPSLLHHNFVYTHFNSDPAYELAPNISIYPRSLVDRDGVTSFSEMEAWIELKDTRDPDPFQDPPEGAGRKLGISKETRRGGNHSRVVEV